MGPTIGRSPSRTCSRRTPEEEEEEELRRVVPLEPVGRASASDEAAGGESRTRKIHTFRRFESLATHDLGQKPGSPRVVAMHSVDVEAAETPKKGTADLYRASTTMAASDFLSNVQSAADRSVKLQPEPARRLHFFRGTPEDVRTKLAEEVRRAGTSSAN